jgi:hypothetical protein
MSSSQGVTLQPTLKGMFREHLNNPTTIVGSLGIPLEVPVSDLETFVKLVGVELIGREDSECLGVHLDDFGDVGSDPDHQLFVRILEGIESLRLHVGDGLVGWVTEIFPVWSLEGSKASVSLVDHSHSSFLIFGDDSQSLVVNDTIGSSAHGVSLGRTVLDIGVEKVLGVVGFQPLGKETELSFIGSGRGQGDLVSPPTSFNGVTGRVDWSGPSLGSSHDNHGPPGLGDGFTGSSGGLDLLDLFQSPLHGCGHVVVDVDVVLIIGTSLGKGSVLDNSDLVTVTSEQAGKLQVVHGTSDGPLSDLVAVGVQDGDNGTTLCGIDVLFISLSSSPASSYSPCGRAKQWQ